LWYYFIIENNGRRTMSCKTCFNCKNAHVNGGYAATRDDPGEAAYAECKIVMVGGKILNQSLFDLGEANEWNEEVMPRLCYFYDPVLIKKCGHCGKVINSPEYSHQFYATDAVAYGEPVPVCSSECKTAYEEKAERKAEEYAASLEEYTKDQENVCRITVVLTCTGEQVPENTVESLDIEEDDAGRDVLTFKCPECGEEHKSLRLG
jgi:hypothetical protein